ncbi:MAG TPA: polyamine ABC transporter ATP-binding protein [Chloroflexi bacterium]|nr:polyamine ABC transporter ATP-binding protein [Chloroflexota bacterium]
MKAVEVVSLMKRFGGFLAVDDVSFSVADGELLTLLGPSGCGKSTTLRCIAGLERPEGGKILIGGKLMSLAEERVYIPPEHRRLGMVFQSYAVWPHMTCFENVAFPLRLRKLNRSEIQRRVHHVLEMVQLTGLEDRYPSQLSGGQQQRVAFARSLVYDPQVLLLDEPLSNLDAKLRDQMRAEISSLQKRLNITFIYVTHDQTEALALSNRIAVMNAGRIIQIGTPHEIYLHPMSRFVADFVGATNLIPGEVVSAKPGQVVVRTPSGLVVTVQEANRSSGQVLVAVRPERLRLSREPDTSGPNIWAATIKERTFLGNTNDYAVVIEGLTLRILTPEWFDVKERVFASALPSDCLIVNDSI